MLAGLSLALVAGTPSLSAADVKVDLEKSVAALDEAGKKPEGQARVLERISKDTSVPVKTLEEQRERSKLGFGGLFIANVLAKETGKTFDQIVAWHKDGKGWGEIAKENNVKLGPVISQAKRAEKAVEHEKDADKRTDGVGKSGSGAGKAPTPGGPSAAPRGGGNGGGRGK